MALAFSRAHGVTAVPYRFTTSAKAAVEARRTPAARATTATDMASAPMRRIAGLPSRPGPDGSLRKRPGVVRRSVTERR